MKTWLKISLILCAFGFLKEIRPSEPYVYEYLSNGNWTHVTGEQVVRYVFPVGTYGYLVLVGVAFLVTDLARYKPLIVTCGICGILIWAMLIWLTELYWMIIMEVIYGTFSAMDVAFFTYMYAKVDKSHYSKVTSNTRVAYLLGRCTSGVLSQLLVSFDVLNYKQLNYITFSAMITATVVSIFLPSVETSIYFHQEAIVQNRSKNKFKKAFLLMKEHFFAAFTQGKVIKWSIGWAIAACGFVQVQNYIQTLWERIVADSGHDRSLYNGAVEAIYTFVGAVVSLAVGYINIEWSNMTEVFLFVYFAIAGAFMILTSKTTSIYVSYASYSILGGIYHMMLTVAGAEVAKVIMEDSYGLVFGINTFVGCALQTILTAIVVSALNTDIRVQYMVYGIYHMVFAVVYIVLAVFKYWTLSKKSKESPTLIKNESQITIPKSDVENSELNIHIIDS